MVASRPPNQGQPYSRAENRRPDVGSETEIVVTRVDANALDKSSADRICDQIETKQAAPAKVELAIEPD